MDEKTLALTASLDNCYASDIIADLKYTMESEEEEVAQDWHLLLGDVFRSLVLDEGWELNDAKELYDGLYGAAGDAELL